MKSLLPYSLIFLAGLIVGRLLSFLHLPEINGDHSFYLGFLLGVIILLFILIRTDVLQKLRWFQVLFLIIFLLISPYLVHSYFDREEKLELIELNNQANKLKDKKALIISEEKQRHLKLVDDKLISFQERSYFADSSNYDLLLNELKQLSKRLGPIENYPLEDEAFVPLSPGRAYLLIKLLDMELNDSLLRMIWKKIDLSSSDLRRMDLSNKMLKGIHLKGSSLFKANLSGSVLDGAILEETKMENANLKNSSLKKAILNNSVLSWSDFREANLEKALLNGCSLKSCLFQSANLMDSKFMWADLSHARFNNCNLKGIDFWTARLDSAEIVNSNLSYARFTDTYFNQTLIENTNINFTAAPQDWLENLDSWKLRGRDEIIANYTIERDSSKTYTVQKYFLKLKED